MSHVDEIERLKKMAATFSVLIFELEALIDSLSSRPRLRVVEGNSGLVQEGLPLSVCPEPEASE